MPLPIESTLWPPPAWAPALDRYRLDEAWWVNDSDMLRAIYSAGNGTGSVSPGENRLAGLTKRGGIRNLFRRWSAAAATPANEKRTDLPMGIAGNLATLSAQQLTSEPPVFRLLEATGDRAGKPQKGTSTDRLDKIANSDDAHMTLIEGGEAAAALGSTVTKLVWDSGDDERDSVWFETIGGDCAFPEFRNGRMIAVNLWTEYPGRTVNRVYRHIERHESGFIIHALYDGTVVNIGKMVPLQSVDALAWIADVEGAVAVQNADFAVALPTGTSRLTAAWWRNLPTLDWRKNGDMSLLGRSDFNGIEPILDAYNEAWGSMMRDVRIGKARAMVPNSMLKSMGIGQGGQFDSEREFYQGMEFLNPDATTSQIVTYQAAIRWQEHMGVLAGLKLELLDGAGWSMSSYGNPLGIQSQGGVTATEVVDRTTKSERTRDQKALYMKQAFGPLMRTALEVDGIVYPGKGGGLFPDLVIEFPDVSQVDPEKQARTFMDLSTAKAISIWETVKERRPNWDDDDVQAEVDRIFDEMQRMGAGGLTDPTAQPINITDPAAEGTDPADDAANAEENGSTAGAQQDATTR